MPHHKVIQYIHMARQIWTVSHTPSQGHTAHSHTTPDLDGESCHSMVSHTTPTLLRATPDLDGESYHSRVSHTTPTLLRAIPPQIWTVSHAIPRIAMPSQARLGAEMYLHGTKWLRCYDSCLEVHWYRAR